VSFTPRLDVARYVAHVLTTLPASKLEWRIFRIEGDRLTFNEIVSGYQGETGKKLEVDYTPVSALKENIAKNPGDFVNFLKLAWAQGKGIVGEEIDNNEWREWSPKKVMDFITL